jgi:hypothetical protein
MGLSVEGGREWGWTGVRAELLQCGGYVLCVAWVLRMWYISIRWGGTANSKYIPYCWLRADVCFRDVCS